MTKRILSVLLSITLILTSFASVGFASTPVVETKLGFGEAEVIGETVKVPVTLSGLPEALDKLASLTADYEYDREKLSYSGVEQGLLGVNTDNAVEGRVSWYQGNAEYAPTADDVLFTLVFAKKEGAEYDAEVKFTYGQITSDDTAYGMVDGLVLGSTKVDLGDLPDAEFFMDYSISEDRQLEVPVYISGLPDKLSDISAFTLEYEYDKDLLSYAGVKSGAIDLGEDGKFDSANKIAWYSTEGFIPDENEELFTLLFDIKADASGKEARIALLFAEAADSNYKFTQLFTMTKIMAQIPEFDVEEVTPATVSLGEPAIEGRDIKIPVVLDTLPGDIENLSSVDFRYSFDNTALTYVGVENGALEVSGAQHVEGHVSWYSAQAYEGEIENTVLFYILLQAAYDVQGETTVVPTMAELADTQNTSEYVGKEGVSFQLPYEASPVEASLEAPYFADEYVYVPVTLNKLPEGLTDITALKYTYSYDDTKLAYVETLSGAIEAGLDYATAGTVSWYSTDAVTDIADELFTLVFKIKGGAEGVAAIEGRFIEIADSQYKVSKDINLNGISFDVTEYAPSEEAQIEIQVEVIGREVKVPVSLNTLPADISDLASLSIEYSYNEEDLKLVGIEAGAINAEIAEDGSIVWIAEDGEAIIDINDDILFILIFEVQYASTGSAEIIITDVTLGDSQETVSGSVSVDTETGSDVAIPVLPEPGIREISSNINDVVIPYEIVNAPNSEEAIKEYVRSLGIVIIIVYVTGEERDVTSLAQFSVDPDTFKLRVSYKAANCQVGMNKEPKTEVAKETVKIITRVDGRKVSRIPLKLNKIPMILGRVFKIVINAQLIDPSKATLNIVSDIFDVNYNAETGKFELTPKASTFSLRRSATGGLTEGEDIEFANIELDATCAQREGADVNVGAMELYNEFGEMVTLDAIGQFNAELPFIDHTWGDWVETLAPTTEAPGSKTRTCTACGETETEEIPKKVALDYITVTPESIVVPYRVWTADDRAAAIKEYISELGTLNVVATLTDGSTSDVTGTAFDNATVSADGLTVTFSYTDFEGTVKTDTMEVVPVLIDRFVEIDPITVPYGTADPDAYVVSAIGDVKGICSDGEEITLDPADYTITIADGIATITLNNDTSIKQEVAVTQITLTSVASALTSLYIKHEDWFNKTDSELINYIKGVAGYKITATLSDDSTLDVSAIASVAIDVANNKAVVTMDGSSVEIALTFLAFGQEPPAAPGEDTPSSGGSSRPSNRPITGGGLGGVVVTPSQPTVPVVDTRVFIDIDQSHYAYQSIMTLYEKGIISGDGARQVKPNDGITRQEIAKTALAIASIPVDTTLTPDFADKNQVSDWAKGYVATAVKEGILQGYEDGTINPQKVITRGEMVAIIVRLLGIQTGDMEASFSDVSKDHWSAPYIAVASELGFVKGYEDGSFKPEKTITRAEAFTIYARVISFLDALKAAAN